MVAHFYYRGLSRLDVVFYDLCRIVAPQKLLRWPEGIQAEPDLGLAVAYAIFCSLFAIRVQSDGRLDQLRLRTVSDLLCDNLIPD